MLKKIKSLFFNNSKILILISLIILAIIFAIFSSYQTSLKNKKNNNFINNIYLKKTLNNIFDNLEPKYKKINHKVRSGETFDKILDNYSVNKVEISIIKKKTLKKDRFKQNECNAKHYIYFR